MIQTFDDKATEDIWNGKATKDARTFSKNLWSGIARKLDRLNAATALIDLTEPKGNHLHALEKDQKGRHAISVNKQYRIRFRFADGHAYEVRCEDYH